MKRQDADQLRRASIALCAAVRSWDHQGVTEALEAIDHHSLCVFLAAMVPEGRCAADLLSWIPNDTPTELRPAHDATALAGRGLVLVAAVRDWDPDKVTAAIRHTDPRALSVVLAAMVPDTVPVDGLLAWTRLEGDHRFTGVLNTNQAA